MHGLKNDYVVVRVGDVAIGDASTLARQVSDRHTGIGSDGLILLYPSTEADVRMVIYNADGSRAQMCGNGIRCVAMYAIDHGLAEGSDVRIETDVGIKLAACEKRDGRVVAVRVNMGTPSMDPASLPATIGSERIVDHAMNVGTSSFLVTCVSVGNPHAIVFIEKLVDADVAAIGSVMERLPVFPERINVHFARIDSPGHVTMRSWERGSGSTLACGTGACAVCVAGVLTGRCERAITTSLPGGELHIEWAHDGRLYMTGSVDEVFDGEWIMRRPI